MVESIMQILKQLDTNKPNMPPTLLYNEGWLLRIILDWYSKNVSKKNILCFKKDSTWYSEGLLSSIFLPSVRGDKTGEAYSHADGVYGHITVGKAGKGDIALKEPFRQFVVLEAKLFSKVASGTTNAPGYNQVARNVACMANIIFNSFTSKEDIFQLEDLAFYLLVPEKQINKDRNIKSYTTKESIKQVVENRVKLCEERKDYSHIENWFTDAFIPVLN